MSLTLYAVDSFTKDGEGGNAAGVVLAADELSGARMLAIAKEAGFSETAFVQESAKASCKVRFFTPTAEVDLCGHATIAAFTLLRSKGIIGDGAFTQETKAGILGIAVKNDLVYMNQALPAYYEVLDKAELADSLAILPGDCLANFPARIVSTGLRDIMLPVGSLNALLSIRPDAERIARLSKKYNVIGIHAFSLETRFGATAHCRNFAPLYDIDEEAATGTANGALACYLYQYGVIDTAYSSGLVFEQGYSLGKPSEILARLSIKNDAVTEVQVGGRAVIRGNLLL